VARDDEANQAIKTMKTRSYQFHRGITKLEIVFVLVIIAVLIGLVCPPQLKAAKAAAKAQATNNAKEIGTALINFSEQYESYPSQDTLQQLQAKGVKVLPIGNDANSYLGQLLAADCIDSEKIFYVKGMEGIHEGDSRFDTPENLLKKGENGFGYVMLQGEKPLVSPGSIVPVVVAPLKSGGSDPVFDEGPFAGQYIYLTPDGAVSGGKINKDGKPIARGRGAGGLFGAGKDSIFEDDVPDVKAPRGL
jgi:type II secretory pathway pseudopilin PulG